MIKFTVGTGKRNWGPDWVHIDGGDYPHITGNDVFLKFQPDNYIDLIYSSHLIAYFDYKEADELFKSWFNKLKPGGTLRIATPDFDRLSALYHCKVPLNQIIGPLYGKMQMGNSIIYHKVTWDFSNLKAALESAGFVDVRIYDHKKTEHPNTGDRSDFYDDHSAAYINKTLISLNVEATKPN